jgi:hypothetical protein
MLIPQEREKHLLFLVENKQKQIPRFARDDNRRDLFHRPAKLNVLVLAHVGGKADKPQADGCVGTHSKQAPMDAVYR